MRSYTNKKGEVINVDKLHLDTAVELKLLLQKNSTGNVCSWAKHKKLMIEEGFSDSENSELYRKMIQHHQKAMGSLPTAETHADKVVTSKLESFKELVGEVTWRTHENRKYLRQINKGKRDIVDGSLFIEEVTKEIRDVLGKVDWKEASNHTFSPTLQPSNTRMVLTLTDWHIGAIVDIDGNSYNYKIAKRRINDAVEQAITIATERRVSQIDVVYQGDILEHAYMRNAQAYHAEFPVARQMALGGRLMIDVLAKLSKKFHVTYRGFAGNHDRMNGDKNGNIDGDTGMVVVNEIVQVYVEYAGIENLTYVDTHHFHAKLLDVNGKNIKLVHGDLEKRDDKKKIADHGSRDKLHYDIIVYGHFHHFMVLEVGINRFEVRVGSTKGSDDYSEKLGLGSAPSQAVILIGEDGEIEIKRIDLRDNWLEVLGVHDEEERECLI